MGKTILVADDSRTIRRAVELTFRTTDFQVVSVDNADQALKSIAEIRPDLILADASMPGTDGYALCNAVKAGSASGRIPVVLLASKFDPFDAGRGEEARADGHIDKPWDTQTLIDLVKSKIGLPLDNGVPQSFAATLAKRGEKSEPEPALHVAAPSNGQAPPASPFAAPIPDRSPARPPPARPPPLAKAVPSSQVTRGAGMGGSLDDVVIEEPVDEHAVGPSLDPPPPPSRHRRKVDVWALDEEVQRAPDAGPPPGADDPIEEIAIDDMPMEEMPQAAFDPPPPRRAVARVAELAAPAVARAAAQAVPGVDEAQMTAMAREIIERIAWEVVPELAETIIRAELKRLLTDE